MWNGSIDKRPAIIAQCAGAADVVAAVGFARDHGLVVAVRGGAHNVAGNAVCDDGIVIDLGAMNSVRVDPDACRVRAGGGATIGAVDRETQLFGLAVPLGVVTGTGIAGLTLCGGHSWLTRQHGFACDNLISVDAVTADGRVLRASENENADLFWAVRGGGGNFGIVTSFEYQAHPVGPEVTFCGAFYRAAAAPEIFRRWRDYMSSAPEAIDRIIARAARRPNPWSLISIRHMGGAPSRVAADATALGGRDAQYMLSIDTSWTDTADTERAIAWTRDFWEELRAGGRGSTYLNFVGEGEDTESPMRASYGDANYERLVAIKTEYDPENMFRLNQNIPPRQTKQEGN